MKRSIRLGLVLTCCLVTVGAVAAAEFDAAYPALDRKQAGTVRHMVKLSLQPDNDWSEMEVGPRQAFDRYQFQLAFMSYALAVVQSQLTPAYRELYKEAADRAIHKMTLNAVWDNWLQVVEAPQFKQYLDTTKGRDWRDPVRDKNIMYSGHVLQMIGLYEVLYDDHKYDKPGSLTYTLPAADVSYSYNHAALAQTIHRQFIDNQFAGIECEPNLIFASCNQHPVLGLMSYDKVHGTKLADVRKAFWERATQLGFINAHNHRFATPYMVKEKVNVNLHLAANDGWNGVMQHAWNKELIQQVWPAQRDASLSALLSTSPEVIRKRWAELMVSTDFGFLAAYAAEVGDDETRRSMLDYADVNLRPVWRDGRYFYPRHDIELPLPPNGPADVDMAGAVAVRPLVQELRDDMLGERHVGPLAGNALLAFARINSGDGLWNTYNKLEATYVANGPEVVGVDFPKVLVNQAFYDQAKGVLAIGVTPGTEYQGMVSFNVRNLSSKAVYDVVVDGVSSATISASRIKSKAGDVAMSWTHGNDLKLEFVLGEGRSILIKRDASRQLASR